MENAACLCSSHHTLVHEGGYTIERVEDNALRLNEQFVQQQHLSDIGQFDVEKELRSDKDSFNTVRSLLPERYRFRITDAQGQVIHSQFVEDGSNTNNKGTGGWATFQADDYTRIYCGEPVADHAHGIVRDRHAVCYTSEPPARYVSTV